MEEIHRLEEEERLRQDLEAEAEQRRIEEEKRVRAIAAEARQQAEKEAAAETAR